MWLSLYLGDESYAIDEYEIYTECESWYMKFTTPLRIQKDWISWKSDFCGGIVLRFNNMSGVDFYV